ncbi:SH3-like domain-containing protein [Bacillus sp. 71mf]|nr:SH3-like domain-containing protein [Bacillus sp. 71mf]SFS77512.1 SH3-like domain-containing protein [Bacillus sp. 103mf]
MKKIWLSVCTAITVCGAQTVTVGNPSTALAASTVTNEQAVNFDGLLKNNMNGNGVWTVPYGLQGASYLGDVTKYSGKVIHVIGSVQAGGVLWYHVQVDGKDGGWFDSKVLYTTTNVNQNQLIVSTSGNGVWSVPYGLNGASYIASANNYVGKDVKLIQKLTLGNVTWYQFSVNNQVIGWLDGRVLSSLTNIQVINQAAVMGATNDNGIWSMPYGLPGANYLGSTNQYALRDLQLIQSTTYQGVQWYKFSVNGQAIGWISSYALDNTGITKPANFSVTIGSTNGNGIWTVPYGLAGAKYVQSTNDYAYQTLQVVKTATIGNVTWYQVAKNGNILGWLDGGKALTDLTNIKDENRAAVIKPSTNGDGIWTVPYGEYGAKFVAPTNDYKFQMVQVVQSATIGSTTWNKIKQGDRILGWVDANILSSQLAYTQLDQNGEVHYNWGSGGPAGFPSQQFQADFVQNKQLSGGDYFVQSFADDGVKVSVDNNLVINRWSAAAGETNRALLPNLAAGSHSIHTQYYQEGGQAAVFSDVVPFGSWLAYYYPNESLSGYPVAAKVLSQAANGGLQEDNGFERSPATGVSGTHFSARYVTAKRLKAGQYLLYTGADDGIRVYVDGVKVVDAWGYHGYNEKALRMNIQDNPNAANGLTDVHWIEVEYMQGTEDSKVTTTLKPSYTFIDVSHWEGNIDWNQVKQSGINAAYMKATEGVSYTDPTYAQYVQNASAAGLLVGAYHFARPESNDPIVEAKHFVDVLNRYHTDLMPVLDLESPSSPTGNITGLYVSNWARTFINYVQQTTGKRVMLYTGPWYITGFNLSGLGDVPLWISRYNSTTPTKYSDWNNWNSWQYTESGNVNGVEGAVDINVTTSLDGLRP